MRRLPSRWWGLLEAGQAGRRLSVLGWLRVGKKEGGAVFLLLAGLGRLAKAFSAINPEIAGSAILLCSLKMYLICQKILRACRNLLINQH